MQVRSFEVRAISPTTSPSSTRRSDPSVGDGHLYLGPDVALAAVLPPVCVTIRPAAAGQLPEENEANGTVERVAFQGSAFEVTARLSDTVTLRASVTIAEAETLGDVLSHGRDVTLAWRPADVIFVEDTEQAGASTEPDIGDVAGSERQRQANSATRVGEKRGLAQRILGC